MNDFLTNLNDEVPEANFLRYSLNTNIPTEACQCQQKPQIKQKYFGKPNQISPLRKKLVIKRSHLMDKNFAPFQSPSSEPEVRIGDLAPALVQFFHEIICLLWPRLKLDQNKGGNNKLSKVNIKLGNCI